MREQFLAQVRLMLRVLQNVAQETCFALKGGTAINFFVRDTPRLSVDIDLTYLPIQPRQDSLKEIGEALGRVKARVLRAIPGSLVEEKRMDSIPFKLMIVSGDARVKLEPNLILRGSVYGAVKARLSLETEEAFQTALEMNVLSLPDLYGGKICAALDRQHPRDLFDIKLLLANDGLTTEIRKAFIVYWVSHNRPMHEIINPARLDIKRTFAEQFEGMTREPVKYEDLVEAREQLINSLRNDLSREERRFVVSVKSGRPDWNLLGITGIDKLPGIQWKLSNIGKMPVGKHQEQLEKLKAALGL